MKGTFSEAAKRLVDDKAGVVAALDSTINTATSEKFSIKGFPTLKYFENGVLKGDYNGKRTSDDIYNFVKSNGQLKDEL